MGSKAKECPHEVLVIDDDPDIREALGDVLGDAGYRVATASDGTEALQYLRTHEAPCVILLDLLMPGMNGWDFRAAQNEDHALANIPVVVITAARADRNSLGASALFQKPIDLERLLPAVELFC